MTSGSLVPHPPAANGGRPASRAPSLMFRVAQVAAVAVCSLLSVGTEFVMYPRVGLSPEEAAHELARQAGAAVGNVVAALMLSALVLGWSRVTRRYIPFLMLGASVMFILPSAAREKRARA
ncbi:MAG TPA: hypothetical protein VF771_18960, partial [Longimicrobiaceae bacterium]